MTSAGSGTAHCAEERGCVRPVASVSGCGLDTSVPLLGPNHVHPGQPIVELDRVAARVQVDRGHIWIGVVPGGVDQNAVDEDVSPRSEEHTSELQSLRQ